MNLRKCPLCGGKVSLSVEQMHGFWSHRIAHDDKDSDCSATVPFAGDVFENAESFFDIVCAAWNQINAETLRAREKSISEELRNATVEQLIRQLMMSLRRDGGLAVLLYHPDEQSAEGCLPGIATEGVQDAEQTGEMIAEGLDSWYEQVLDRTKAYKLPIPNCISGGFRAAAAQRLRMATPKGNA